MNKKGEVDDETNKKGKTRKKKEKKDKAARCSQKGQGKGFKCMQLGSSSKASSKYGLLSGTEEAW